MLIYPSLSQSVSTGSGGDAGKWGPRAADREGAFPPGQQGSPGLWLGKCNRKARKSWLSFTYSPLRAGTGIKSRTQVKGGLSCFRHCREGDADQKTAAVVRPQGYFCSKLAKSEGSVGILPREGPRITAAAMRLCLLEAVVVCPTWSSRLA